MNVALGSEYLTAQIPAACYYIYNNFWRIRVL